MQKRGLGGVMKYDNINANSQLEMRLIDLLWKWGQPITFKLWRQLDAHGEYHFWVRFIPCVRTGNIIIV